MNNTLIQNLPTNCDPAKVREIIEYMREHPSSSRDIFVFDEVLAQMIRDAMNK